MMGHQSYAADVINWGSCLSPLADTRHWPQALGMLKPGIDGTNIRNALMSAMRGDWRWASEALWQMDLMNLQPDELSFNTLASALSSATKWRDALHLGTSASKHSNRAHICQ